MRALFCSLVFLSACEQQVDLGDKDAPLADLGDPYVALVAAVTPDYLRSDCLIGVELFEVDATEPTVDAWSNARGGEWAGVLVEGAVQFQARATWSSCTPGPEGSGEFASSTFSGVQGNLFLFHYNGVNAAFETLEQRVDFDGGLASVSFRDNATTAEIEALAESLDVSAESTSTETFAYTMSWTDARSVGEVLSAFSEDPYYLSGSPTWIRQPDWW